MYAVAVVVIATLSVAGVRLRLTDAGAANIQPFSNSFGDYIWGDFLLVGNQVLRCPTAADLDVDDVDQDGDTTETLGSAVDWSWFDECAAQSNSNDVAVVPNDFRWRVYSNVDTTTAGLFNSSSAVVTVPPGASIRFAELVWSGNTTQAKDPKGAFGQTERDLLGPEPWSSCNASSSLFQFGTYGQATAYEPYETVQARLRAAARPTPITAMKLRIDDGSGSAAYADVSSTNTQVGPQSLTGEQYKSMANVTQQLQAAVDQYGTGVPLTLTGANLPTGEGFNCAGGWSVSVVYEYPQRNVTYAPDYRFVQVSDGFSSIAAADPPEDFALTPFVASQGTVEPRFGVLAYEGDQGIQGDALTFEGVNVVEPRITGDPLTNFWVGTIGDYTTRNNWLGARTPSVPNNEGWDAKVVPFDTGVLNGVTNTLTGQFKTAGDQYSVDQFLFSATISVLTGAVYEDLDGDGVRDPDEPGIEGVTMTLTGTNSEGTPVDLVATTDQYGNYYFENLLPSDSTGYTLTETQPVGYLDGSDTVGSAGGADGTVSGTDQISGIMHDGTQGSIDYNFGDVKPASISGTVLLDPDADPSTDNSTGIGGVEIRLTGTDINGQPVDLTVPTNPDGTYEFLNLVAGTYTITETQPTQYSDGPDVVGSAGGVNDTNDVLGQVVLGSNTTATGYDFVENGATVAGLVYEDLNGNGAWDLGETGIGGVTVTLESSDGTTTVLSTEPDGTYAFIGLAADTYTVTETQPGGYADAAETTGTGGGAADTNDVISQISVAAGETVDGYAFGEVQPATLGDHVFLDLDGDGFQDPGEPGIPGVAVSFSGSSTATDTTDASGNYLLEGLSPGTGTVSFTVPDGYVTSPVDAIPGDDADDSDGTTVNALITSGDAITNVDLGLVGTGSIGDTLFYDLDKDGVVDPGEPTLPAGVTVTATWYGWDGVAGGGDDLVFTTETDAAGQYSFTMLPPGAYSVVVDTSDPQFPGGFQPISDLDGIGSPNETHVVLGDDPSTPGVETNPMQAGDIDFGYTGTGSIGQTVYFDADGDGVQDPNETGLAGVDVTLIWYGLDGVPGGGDDVTLTAVTASDGSYLFDNLPAGPYRITVDSGDVGSGLSVNSADPDGGTASESLVTLVAGEDRLDQNFGYTGTGTIGDTVVLDLAGDGIDASDVGIAGVDVTATWAGPDGAFGTADDVVYTTVTDADGNYLFSNLPAGDFTVEIDSADLPVGVTSSVDPDGTGDPFVWSGSVAAGESLLNVDFAVAGTGTIGDQVWLDLDADGTFSAGDLGLSGIPVSAVWAGPDGEIGTADDVTWTTTTDVNGNYTFENLPAGTFEVTADLSGAPAGTSVTQDPDGTGATNQWIGDLADGATITDVDFPLGGTGSIGDLLFMDVNGNGVADQGDFGLAGVAVTLTWAGLDGKLGTSDDVVQTQTTGADGTYSFTNLPAGDFTVSFDTADPAIPEGLAVVTADPDGGADATADVTLTTGQVNTTTDFGLTGTGTIGDTVVLDLARDGIDASDVGIAGVDVTATWAGPDGAFGTTDDVVYATVTDADGKYLFSNLPAGEFTVEIDGADLPAGVTSSVDPDGTGDPFTWSGPLATGESLLNVDFAVAGTGTIGDQVWLDLDGNDAFSAGDLGLPGVPVSAVWAGPDGELGTADDVTWSTTTDADGKYSFDNLPAGTYQVTADLSGAPAGTSVTLDPDGTGATNQWIGDLADGATISTVDFPLGGTASIGQTVYFDIDGDGVQGPNETGLASVDVTLIWYGADGVPGGGDDLTLSTVTGSDGSYLFDNLPAGSFRIVVDSADVGSGSFLNSADPDGGAASESLVTLVAGEDRLDQNFGYTGTGTIGDTVVLDLAGDGIDASDVGIAGVDVTATWAGPDGEFGTADDVVYTTVTDADGKYLFSNLPAGDFTVAIDGADLPAGVTSSVDPDATWDPYTWSGSLATGESLLNVDFAVAGTGTIGDQVWVDLDGNASFSSGDLGLAGVPVTAVWAGPDGKIGTADDVTWTTTTDANGNYTFDNLPAGTYQVTADLSGAPAGTSVTQDPDGTGATNQWIGDLADGATISNVDFPLGGTGSIGDQLFMDVNGNGTRDPGDTGLAGVEVTLTWAGLDGELGTSDDVVQTQTTGADGTYEFTNLPAGDFTVSFDTADPAIPNGLGSVTADPDGGADATAAVTLTTGQANTTTDFGLTGTGTIGNTVLLDVAGDGIDASDVGIAGVDVTATWAGPDGEFGTADDVVYTTVTDADGTYLFSNLPAGDFTVVIDSADLPAGVTSSVDPDGTGDPYAWSGSLATGESLSNVDFAVAGTGTIGDQVWVDLDADGTFSTGDLGLPGVPVTAVWAGPDGELGTADDVTWTTTTDANGNYTFENLPSGTYQVTADLSGAPTGTSVTQDPDGTGATNQWIGDLADGATISDVDFALVGTGSIGDQLLMDVNGNGVLDPGDAGLAGVEVTLTWAGLDGKLGTSDDVVQTQTTGADGTYAFTNLPAGDFTVSFDTTDPAIPAGLSSVSADPDGGADATAAVTLTTGEANTSTDFGLTGTGSIGNTVWLDADGDGFVDPGEPGIGGVGITVTWFGPDGVLGTPDDVAYTTVTAADGTWSIDGLPFGEVQVAVDTATLPSWAQPVSDPDGVVTPSVAVVEIVGSAIPASANFGYQGSTLVGDQVVYDVDGDGSIGPNDAPLAGVGITITWWGADGVLGTPDDATWTTVTDSEGLWSVSGVPEGTVTATLDPATIPAGMVVTFDGDSTPDGSLTFPIESGTTLVLNVDFGLTGTGSINQVTWEDIDGDGVQDANEPATPGVEFTLTWAGVDGVLGTADDVVQHGVTDADGAVHFDNLPAGEYLFEVDPETVPEGTTLSLPLGDGDQWEGTLGPAEVRNFETAVRKPLADLEVTKALDGELVNGEDAHYVIKAVNHGPGIAVGPVLITDELPKGLTFVSASGVGVTCTGTVAIRCETAGDMAVGDSVQVDVVATVSAAAGSVIANGATVATGDGLPDANPDNDTDVAEGTVVAAGSSTTTTSTTTSTPETTTTTTASAAKLTTTTIPSAAVKNVSATQSSESSMPSVLAMTGSGIGILGLGALLIGLGLLLLRKKRRDQG